MLPETIILNDVTFYKGTLIHTPLKIHIISAYYCSCKEGIDLNETQILSNELLLKTPECVTEPRGLDYIIVTERLTDGGLFVKFGKSKEEFEVENIGFDIDFLNKEFFPNMKKFNIKRYKEWMRLQ